MDVSKLIAESLAIEAQEAKEAGSLGYMARVLVQATMPHKKFNGDVFERRNGAFSMAIIAHPGMGLPYGTYPRLLLTWLTTEAVKTKTPELVLGPTLSGPRPPLWPATSELPEEVLKVGATGLAAGATRAAGAA